MALHYNQAVIDGTPTTVTDAGATVAFEAAGNWDGNGCLKFTPPSAEGYAGLGAAQYDFANISGMGSGLGVNVVYVSWYHMFGSTMDEECEGGKLLLLKRLDSVPGGDDLRVLVQAGRSVSTYYHMQCQNNINSTTPEFLFDGYEGQFVHIMVGVDNASNFRKMWISTQDRVYERALIENDTLLDVINNWGSFELGRYWSAPDSGEFPYETNSYFRMGGPIKIGSTFADVQTPEAFFTGEGGGDPSMTIEVADTFTEAVNTNLTSHTPDTGGGTWSVGSGTWTVAEATDDVGNNGIRDHAWLSNVSASADSYCEVVGDNGGSIDTNRYFGAICRHTGAARGSAGASGYVAIIINAATNQLTLQREVAGVFTDLGAYTIVGYLASTAYTIRLECDGDQISCYLDDTLRIGPVTDTNVSAAGKFGITGRFAEPNITSMEGGTLGAAAAPPVYVKSGAPAMGSVSAGSRTRNMDRSVRTRN